MDHRKFPSLGGVARSAGVVLLAFCRKMTDHPVSRFATATPPKEGNWPDASDHPSRRNKATVLTQVSLRLWPTNRARLIA